MANEFSRRTVIVGAAVAPLLVGGLSLFTAQAAQEPVVIYDSQLVRAKAAAHHARSLGLSAIETNGEIALLLMGNDVAPSRPVLAITGYSELVLGQDILRARGHRPETILTFGAKDEWLNSSALPAALLSIARQVLLPASELERTRRSTGFVWFARKS